MRNAVLAGAAVLAATATPAWAQADSSFVEHALASVPRGVNVQSGIEFAPDGSQVAYVGSKDGKSVPVIGAKVFDAYCFVDHPRFGGDGHVAFRVINRSAERVQKCWVLLDGKRTAQNDGIDELVWIPDGDVECLFSHGHEM